MKGNTSKMNIPNHFDIEEKLLSDRNSRCNKFLLKLYYIVVCFLKSFVLIALAVTIIIVIFKQVGVEIKIGKLVDGFYDEEASNITISGVSHLTKTQLNNSLMQD